MESGVVGETFYIKKETMAQRLLPTLRVALQRERWISCGFSRALGCAVFRARVEKGERRRRKRIKIFAKIGGGLRYRVISLPSFSGNTAKPDSIGFAPAVMVCITPWKKRATLFACHLHAICI